MSARPAGLRPAAVPAAFDAGAFAYDRLVGANPGYHEHLRLSARRLGDAGFTGVHSETVPEWQGGLLHTFLASRPALAGGPGAGGVRASGAAGGRR